MEINSGSSGTRAVPIYRQLRLRHLRQIIGVNFTSHYCCDGSESLYFSIHKLRDGLGVYQSETCRSIDPVWKPLPVSFSDGNAEGIIIKLWSHSDEETMLLYTYGIYFSGLSVWPKEVDCDPGLFKSNVLIFILKGDKYIIKGSSLEPIKMLDQAASLQEFENSYNIKTAKRMRVVGRTLVQRSLKINNLTQNLTSLLSKLKTDCGYISSHVMELKLKITILKEQILRTKDEMEVKRNHLEKLESDNKTRTEKLHSDKESISDSVSLLTLVVNKLNLQVKSYYSVLKKSDVRQRDLMSQMMRIYPMYYDRDGKYYIRRLHFPVTDKLKGTDETETSVTLGYICHLVLWLVTLIKFPLSYPINYQSSRSTIRDDISVNLENQYRLVPLYLRGNMELLTDYGLYLLNKNIAQLRWYCGLETVGLKSTLPNLMELLNHILHGQQVKILEFPHLAQQISGNTYQVSSEEQCEEFFILNGLPNSAFPSLYNLSRREGSVSSLLEHCYTGEQSEAEINVKEQQVDECQVSHKSPQEEVNIPYASEAFDVCEGQYTFDFQLRADALASESRTFKLAKVKSEP